MTRLVGLEVDVRPVINEAADYHLGDLQRGDQHHNEPGREEAHGPGSVVRVHQRVHAVIHHNKPASRRGVLLVGVPRV